MEAEEYLRFFYPFFSDGSDYRYVSAADREMALEMAGDLRFVPTCLGLEKQAMAKAHYAAHLLFQRLATYRASYQPAAAPQDAVGAVKREREGDVEVEYFAAPGEPEMAPNLVGKEINPLAEWRALMRLCGGGSMITCRV